MLFDQPVSSIAHVRAGKLRVLGISSSKRFGTLQDIPTIAEQGVPDKAFQLKGFICIVGPTGMPPEMVQRLSDLMVEGGKTEKVQKILTTFGIDEAAVSHQEFRKLYDEEGPIWIALVKSLGLTPQ